jgi:hypothetical protein
MSRGPPSLGTSFRELSRSRPRPDRHEGNTQRCEGVAAPAPEDAGVHGVGGPGSGFEHRTQRRDVRPLVLDGLCEAPGRPARGPGADLLALAQRAGLIPPVLPRCVAIALCPRRCVRRRARAEGSGRRRRPSRTRGHAAANRFGPRQRQLLQGAGHLPRSRSGLHRGGDDAGCGGARGDRLLRPVETGGPGP